MNLYQLIVRLTHAVWLFALCMLVLVALYMAIGRQFFPLIVDYKDDLERVLSEQTGGTVEIGNIKGGWRWLDPVVVISDINIRPAVPNQQGTNLEKPAAPLHLQTFTIHLSALQSLLKWKLQFQAIEAKGLRLPLFQDADGGLSVPGFEIEDSSHEVERDFNEILSILEQPSLYISDFQIDLSTANGDRSAWKIPRAIMAYDGKAFSASGEVLHSRSEEPFLRFSAKGAGWVLSSEFTGKLYVDWVTGQFLDDYIRAYKWEGLSIDNLDASGRMWIDILKGDVLSLQGEVSVDTLQWMNEAELVAPLENIKADMFYSRLGNNSIMTVYNLSMDWLHYRWAPSSYAMYVTPEELNIGGQELNVSMLSEAILATKILPAGAQDELFGYRPAGSLKNIGVRIPLSPDPVGDSAVAKLEASESTDSSESANATVSPEKEDKSPLFELSANADNVSVIAFGASPLVGGINGYLSMTDTHGSIMLDSDNFELGFPTLFQQSWSLVKSQAIVNWDMNASGLKIYSDSINLYFSDESMIFGDFSTIVSDTEEDILSLRIGMDNLDASSAYQFIPYEEGDSGLNDWIKFAIKGGVVESGMYVWYGSLEDDASDDSFTSSLSLNTHDVRLRFDPEWPEIEDISSNIFLQNSYLDINAPSASIRGAPLVNTRAVLPATAGSLLEVTSSAKPSAEDIKYWLNDSPIKEHTKEISEQLSIKGEMDLGVTLGISLDDDDADVKYDLSIGLKDTHITHIPTDLQFEETNGVVNISDSKGLSARNVKLKAFKQDATLNISSRANRGHLDSTLRLNGSVTISELQKQFLPNDSLPLTGGATYMASLLLPGDAAKNALLTVNSDLKGISIDVPEPFGKESRSVETFDLKLNISDAQVLMDASLGKKAGIRAQFVEERFRQGMISIGSVNPKLTGQKGLRVTGELNQLDVESWISYLTEELDADEADDVDDVIRNISFSVGDLNFYDQHFVETEVEIIPENGVWNIDLDGRDIVGDISLANKSNRIKVLLDKVSLKPAPDSVSSTNVEDEEKLSPKDIPEMSLLINNLIYDGTNMGRWSANVVHDKNGIIAKGLTGKLATGHLKGRLSWSKDSVGTHTSIFTSTIKGTDVSDINHALSKDTVTTSSEYSSDVSLVWSGSPLEFSLSELSGRIKVELKDGTITAAKGTGALRLFGILNAEAITRRLKLDFSDVYQQGLGYDLIAGEASINKGFLKLKEPLEIKGPSSAYKFTGTADLRAETLDMEMVVVLPLAKNLPLAALLVGAPQIGGAVWVVDKILGEPLSKLTSATYELKGSWDDPTMELKNVFDRTSTSKGASRRKR